MSLSTKNINRCVADWAKTKKEYEINEKNLAVIGLCESFFDLINGMEQCINIESRTSVDVLMRSILEHYSKIINIIRNGDYHKILKYDLSNYISNINKLNENNTFIVDSDHYKSYLELRELLSKRLEKTGSHGGKSSWNIYQGFEKLDAIDFYRSVYVQLSNASHGNIIHVEMIPMRDHPEFMKMPFDVYVSPHVTQIELLCADVYSALRDAFGCTGIDFDFYNSFLARASSEGRD